MTDKEILAELKKSYEYLRDIRENGCEDHCCGQMGNNINLLDDCLSNLETIYSGFYNGLDKKDLRVKKLESENEEIYICGDVDGDYDCYNKDIHEETSFTCGDVDYYWYDDKEFLLKEED